MNSSTVPTLVPGIAVGPYRIANVPGGRAVGEAIELATHRRVAVKRLPDCLATELERWESYRQLLESLKDLRHPNVLEIYGAELHHGDPYLVMEFAARGSLADQVTALGRLPWHEATRRLIDATRAIEAAHKSGLIHGAIRPSNLLLTADGVLKTSDFTGGLFPPRTGDYSAPEVLGGVPPTVASDIYSLGACYFALLTGHAPFAEAGDETALARLHAEKPVPSVRSASSEMPLRCEMIIKRAMAKAAEARYPSAAALRADLETVAQTDESPAPLPPAVHARRRRFVISADTIRRGLTFVALLAALGVAAYFSILRPLKPATKEKAITQSVELPTIINALGMRLVGVPPGTFIMGDPLVGDAKPHRVRLTRSFYVGAREVTQAEFQNIMATNPSHFRSDERPVDSVTWFEAREFCERLSDHGAEKTAGRSYRLPTEAEWEYCCRASETTALSSGRRPSIDRANILTGGLKSTTPAGAFPANAWGLFDMQGNLWEWCRDWYKSDYYQESPIDDPPGPNSGVYRVARGGAWSAAPEACTPTHRGSSFRPDERRPDVGFRVVCIVSEMANPE